MESNRIENNQLVSQVDIFKGQADNPLLAPRGVCLINNHLWVTDTGQNRVFLWKSLPKTEFQKPDLVLGQQQADDTGRNSGGGASASTFFYPSGIWSDGLRLIVADAWNHRVLIWLEYPTSDGQAADVVIGQKEFSQNEPNIDGVGHPPSERSLYWPYGVYSDGTSLWIADTGNRRVLYYKSIPSKSFAAADGVIGKNSFKERDYDHTSAIWPYSVKISPEGKMAITDTQYYRILIWDNWKDGFLKPADHIIGQKDFNSNGMNQFRTFPESNTLNWCYDTCFYKEGIWIADTGNSRILWYPEVPDSNDMSAQDLLGQDNFTTGSENKNSIWSTEGSYYWPFSLCINQGIMVAADTGNHRIIFNHLVKLE